MKRMKLFPPLPQTIPKPFSGSSFSFTDFEQLSVQPPPDDSDTTYGNGGPDGQLSPYWFLLIALLALFFLIVSYYVIISDCCSRWRHQQSRDVPAETPDDSPVDHENGMDHSISYNATVGLRPSEINSIEVCRFKKGGGFIEGTDCYVCLDEFQEGETLRLLPHCSHAFHISCIDTWLGSHSNCPLCRAGIISDCIAATCENLETTIGVQDDVCTHGGGGTELGSIQRRHSDSTQNRAGTGEPNEFAESNILARNRGENVCRWRSVSFDSSTSVALLRGFDDFGRSYVGNEVGNGKPDSESRPAQDEPSSSSTNPLLRRSPLSVMMRIPSAK